MLDRPDVLFIVLDSVRRDRVSKHGHDRETTPTLDAFADTATQFEQAYAPAPWTLPSHSSMFTGLTPSEHGVTNGFSDRTPRLPDGVSTLAERLSEREYRTAGFSNNPWVGQLTGLDRGFEEFVEWDLEISHSADSALHSRTDRLYSRLHKLLGQAARQPVFVLKRPFFTSSLVDRATRWLDHAVDRDAPTFTFLNLMEAHSPYFPPDRAFRSLGLDAPNPIEPRMLNTKLLAYVMGKTDLDPALRERIMEYYDASLRYEDAKVKALFETLRANGTFDETLIVVCSDHGKTLGEFDRDGTPPHYLRDINVSVPLLVKLPFQTSPRRVDFPFELATLHDLVLDPSEETLTGPDRKFALVEDSIPHTGKTSEDVTRWRVVARGEDSYLRAEDGRSFVLRGRGADEAAVDADRSTVQQFEDALDRRVDELGGRARDHSEGEMNRDVQRQLRDLGYM